MKGRHWLIVGMGLAAAGIALGWPRPVPVPPPPPDAGPVFVQRAAWYQRRVRVTLPAYLLLGKEQRIMSCAPQWQQALWLQYGQPNLLFAEATMAFGGSGYEFYPPGETTDSGSPYLVDTLPGCRWTQAPWWGWPLQPYPTR